MDGHYLSFLNQNKNRFIALILFLTLLLSAMLKKLPGKLRKYLYFFLFAEFYRDCQYVSLKKS